MYRVWRIRMQIHLLPAADAETAALSSSREELGGGVGHCSANSGAEMTAAIILFSACSISKSRATSIARKDDE